MDLRFWSTFTCLCSLKKITGKYCNVEVLANFETFAVNAMEMENSRGTSYSRFWFMIMWKGKFEGDLRVMVFFKIGKIRNKND